MLVIEKKYMKLTIKEIARIAGVHRSTVDKVLHNREGVSDKVRQKIQTIIDETEYEPNPIGRALKRQGKKIVISAVLLNVDALSLIQNGLKRALATYKGINVDLNYHITPFLKVEEQIKAIDAGIREKIDGLLITPINDPDIKAAIGRAKSAGIPVITINDDLPGSGRLCFVGQDGYKAGQVAGRLMGEFQWGKGKILIITRKLDIRGEHYLEDRVKGFIDHLNQHLPNLDITEKLESLENPETVYKKTIEVLRARKDITGIYITCGGVVGVGNALKELGEERNIKVVCFERYSEIINLINEGVITCTIDSDLDMQGYKPCNLMMDHLLYGKPIENELEFTEIKVLVKENI